ncbi:MAG: cyclic nucleotide-binding domain-containing protein [Rhizobacter sp.]
MPTTARFKTPSPQSDSGRPRPLTDYPELARSAAALLRTPTALDELSEEDAKVVVSYMWAVGYKAGATVLRAGDSGHTGCMLLLLRGEVSVETDSAGISVLGAGHVIGEMSVIDGAARATDCVVLSQVEAGALTREALHKLIDDRPAVAAKLMLAIAQRMADRLRATGDQLRMMTKLLGETVAKGQAAR